MSQEVNAVRVYRNFASYYDAYVGDFAGDFAIYLNLLHPDARVLEVGCGTGRLLKPVLERGHNVVGLDISEDMLALARDKLSGYIEQGRLRLLNHNLTDNPLPEKFDRVLVSFYTFNYILNREEALSFLVNTYKSMQTGGILVMDLFCPTAIINPGQDGQWNQRQITIGNETILLRDRRTLQDGIETREQIYKGLDHKEEIATNRRFYDKREITELLRQAGFIDIVVTNGYALEGFHHLEPDEATVSSFVVKAYR